MRGVTESMAGRAAVLQLLPLSTRESDKVNLLRGGYPEAVARPGTARLWFSSFVQTYLERDVRAVTAVKDLATFRRFLALLASRHGQVLNKTDLAAPLGVSVPTITQWLGVLETTAQILVVPPFYENLGKRLIKSPKVYLADAGLACHLLGIDTASELAKSPFLGALFEGFIASEILKAQANSGRRRELYYFRDEQGLEVDFLLPGRGGAISFVECQAGRTVTPAMAGSMQRPRRSVPNASDWRKGGGPFPGLSAGQGRRSGDPRRCPRRARGGLAGVRGGTVSSRRRFFSSVTGGVAGRHPWLLKWHPFRMHPGGNAENADG